MSDYIECRSLRFRDAMSLDMSFNASVKEGNRHSTVVIHSGAFSTQFYPTADQLTFLIDALTAARDVLHNRDVVTALNAGNAAEAA